VVTPQEHRTTQSWYRIEDIHLEESRGERLPKERKQIITSLRRPIDAWQISTQTEFNLKKEYPFMLQENLIKMYEASFRENHNLPALSDYFSKETLTYLQMAEQVARLHLLFDKLGVKQGDKIALMLPNIIQYPIALFGSLLAGCTVINVNPMYKSSELVHQLKDSGARTIIVISNFAHTLQRALHDIDLDNIIITELGDECGALKGTLINFAVRHFKRLVPRFKILNTISYKQVLLEGENFPYTRPVVLEKDLAFLQYTGGTTGQAKGAMLTHRNILANVAQAFSMYGQVLNEGKEILLTAIPLYHVFALTVNCFLSLRIGGDSVLVADPRNMKNLVKVMTQSNITIMTGVNTLFNALINNERFCQTLLP
jgi:long-chain acyl-CoA synthetase